MPYNPSLPADATKATAAEMRAQLTGLKALIDAIPAGPTGPSGPPGPSGDSSPGVSVCDMTRTSAQNATIGTGSVTLAFTAASSNLGWMLGMRLRAASAADPANSMEGAIDALSTTSVTFTVDATGGAGTFADWVLTPASVRPVAATSSNNASIGSAAMDLSYTAAGPVGWKIGMRLRGTSRGAPSEWFEGVLSSFTASLLHLDVDAFNGTPGDTFNDWDLAPPPGPDGVSPLPSPFVDPDTETLRAKLNELIAALRR